MKIVIDTFLGLDGMNCHYKDPRFKKLWK